MAEDQSEDVATTLPAVKLRCPVSCPCICHDMDGYDAGEHGPNGGPCPGKRIAAAPLMLDVLARFAEGDPCHYDPHGYCQMHSLHERPCPYEQATALLEQFGSRGSEDAC